MGLTDLAQQATDRIAGKRNRGGIAPARMDPNAGLLFEDQDSVGPPSANSLAIMSPVIPAPTTSVVMDLPPMRSAATA